MSKHKPKYMDFERRPCDNLQSCSHCGTRLQSADWKWTATNPYLPRFYFDEHKPVEVCTLCYWKIMKWQGPKRYEQAQREFLERYS